MSIYDTLFAAFYHAILLLCIPVVAYIINFCVYEGNELTAYFSPPVFILFQLI